MLQVGTVIDPQVIRDAFNEDRTQMTLMLARKMNTPEIAVIRALEGDLSRELEFTR